MEERRLMLLIDSNPDDLFLLQRALKRVGVRNPIQAMSGVTEARAYLLGEGVFRNWQQFPVPAVIVMDLDQPAGQSFEFLTEIRQLEQFKNTPVVVLGREDRGRTAQRAYDLGANAYFAKEVDIYAAAKVLRDLDFLEDVLEVESARSSAA